MYVADHADVNCNLSFCMYVVGTCGNAKVLYTGSVSGKSAAHSRVIPQKPERVLDAPELIDDYC